MIRIILFFVSLFFLYAPRTFAHTGVGSGGDVVAAYLEETRVRLLETFYQFLTEKPEDRPTFCHRDGLSAAEQEDCRFFVTAVANDMIRLSRGGLEKVNFKISAEPLYVEGRDGKLERVAARTLTGPQGEIEFDYQLIVTRSPKMMLALLFHELGHKVMFVHGPEGDRRDHIEDNKEVLHFATGRRLLDEAGLAFAEYALVHGVIGQSFMLRDQFVCLVKIGEQNPVYQALTDIRTFRGSGEKPEDLFKSFDIRLQKPRHNAVGVYENPHCLSLQVELQERTGCSADDKVGRRSVLSLYRYFSTADGETPRPPELLEEKVFSGWNPACEEEKAQREQPMELSYRGTLFSCIYKGSQGDARGQAKFFASGAQSDVGLSVLAKNCYEK